MDHPELPLVVEPAWLAANLDRPDLLIVDLGDPPAFARGHVPGAAQLPYASLIRSAPPVGGLVPDAGALVAHLRAIGLSNRSRVVAYDDEGGGRAARLLWTLALLGHPAGSLLDGGMRAWAPEGYPMDAHPGAMVAGDFEPGDGGDAAADRAFIEGRLGDADFRLLDARSPAEFRGEDVRAARGGHIPGAVNFEWTRAMDTDRSHRLKPPEVLRVELAGLGFDPDTEVVTYCQTHHRSSFTYWMLRWLGYPRVRGYPGSWSDWGNAPGAPIER